MFVRSCLLVGLAVGLGVACGGSSKEFSSSGGTGGTATSGGTAGAGGSKGGSGGSGGSGGEAVAVSDAPAVVAVELCGTVFECCSEEERMNLSVLGGSESGCQFAVAAYITLLLNAANDSLVEGRLTYDGTALAGCVDDYAARDCSMLRGLDSFDCPGLLVPQIERGGACGISAECIDGYCDGSNDASNPVGQCAAKKNNGANCADAGECLGGACDSTLCADAVTTTLCGG